MNFDDENAAGADEPADGTTDDGTESAENPTEQEVDVDTLERRLLEELEKAGTTYIGEMVFGAWARRPE